MTERDMCAELLILSGAHPEKCIKCGKCSASCPAYEAMDTHPHEFVNMLASGRYSDAARSQAIYRCLSCFTCVERCPRDVRPANVIEALRSLSMREKGKNRHSPEELAAGAGVCAPQQLMMSAMRKYGK